MWQVRNWHYAPGNEPLVCEPMSCSPMASNWVLLGVKDIQHVVGLCCEGFEGQFMALLIAIEASQNQKGWNSNSKSAVRSIRELKR
jgi:predicted nucleic acid-binding Zn finger protein